MVMKKPSSKTRMSVRKKVTTLQETVSALQEAVVPLQGALSDIITLKSELVAVKSSADLHTSGLGQMMIKLSGLQEELKRAKRPTPYQGKGRGGKINQQNTHGGNAGHAYTGTSPVNTAVYQGGQQSWANPGFSTQAPPLEQRARFNSANTYSSPLCQKCNQFVCTCR